MAKYLLVASDPASGRAGETRRSHTRTRRPSRGSLRKTLIKSSLNKNKKETKKKKETRTCVDLGHRETVAQASHGPAYTGHHTLPCCLGENAPLGLVI